MAKTERILRSIKQCKALITAEEAKAKIVERLKTYSTCDSNFFEKVKTLPISAIKKTHVCYHGVIAHEISYSYSYISVTLIPYSSHYADRVTEDQDGNEIDRTPLYVSGKTEYKERKFAFKYIHGDTVLRSDHTLYDRFESEPVSEKNKEKVNSIIDDASGSFGLFEYVESQDYAFRVGDDVENRSVEAKQFIFDFCFVPYWEMVVDGHRFSVNALSGEITSFSFELDEACKKRSERLLRDLEKKDRKEEKRWNRFMVFLVLFCALMIVSAVSVVFTQTVFFRWILIVVGAVTLFIYFFFLYDFIKEKNGSGNRAKTFRELLKNNDFSLSLYRQARKEKAYVRERRTYTFWYIFITVLFVLSGSIGYVDFGDVVEYLFRVVTFDTPFWHLIFG